MNDLGRLLINLVLAVIAFILVQWLLSYTTLDATLITLLAFLAGLVVFFRGKVIKGL